MANLQVNIKEEKIDEVYLPEYSQYPSIKFEPEENIDDYTNTDENELTDLKDEPSENSSVIKITSVIGNFDENENSKVNKRGRKRKNEENIDENKKAKRVKGLVIKINGKNKKNNNLTKIDKYLIKHSKALGKVKENQKSKDKVRKLKPIDEISNQQPTKSKSKPKATINITSNDDISLISTNVLSKNSTSNHIKSPKQIKIEKSFKPEKNPSSIINIESDDVNQKLLHCDHCGKSFKSKYNVLWHMKVHMKSTPFNCKLCGKGFSYDRSFKQHMLTHAEKVKCEICDKRLKPHAMYYHMKYRHVEEKTHQCTQCSKSFKTRDNMQRHLMRHNLDFKCELCGRNFAENSRLQMHMKMHTNPEDFMCKICNKSFEHIDRHMRHLHGKARERNFKCKYCQYATDNRQTITRHEEMHEKRIELKAMKKKKKIDLERIECSTCGVSLQTKQGYKSHLRHYHNGVDVKKEENNICIIKIEKEEISK